MSKYILVTIIFIASSLLATAQNFSVLDSVKVKSARQSFGIVRLKDVDGAGIYAGKKSEVIVLKDLTVNKATNNARQIYGKVPGLNIWESDGSAGLQLSIGGRGLDPNRTSNFNTRQNGYDISADALGYPESYYTPPAEAVERIEIVRGAASLQFGTQFGGIINFKMNRGVDTSKAQIISRLTGGSWGFVNSSTSVGGTVNKINYYALYQHKQGDGWRSNSKFNDNTVYLSTVIKATKKISITAQYTGMSYLEQQPGGVSDDMFAQNPRQSTKTRNYFRVNWNLGAVLIDYAISSHLKFNSRFFGLIADRSALGVINTVKDPYPDGPRQYRTDNYNNFGNESRLIYTYHTKGDKPYTLLGGVRYYNGHTVRQIGDGNYGSGGAKADFTFNKSTPYDSLNYSKYRFPSHNIALFAENIFHINAKLSIIPGARFENIVTEANGFYNNIFADQNHNVISYADSIEHRTSRRSFFIGGIGISYIQSSSTQLYANISQNYRAINFNDMSIVDANYLVDPNLKDETGYSADMGIRGHISNILNYDISLFTLHYDNRIGVIPDPADGNKLYTTNVSKSRNIGVESFAEVDIWKLIKGEDAKMKLAIFSNLSYTDARYVHSQNSAVENKLVESVPPVIFKTGITFEKNKLAASLQYSYTGQQYGDATNAVAPGGEGIYGIIPSYYVVDFTADYKFNKLFMLSGSLNNITSNSYFTRRALSYPGPGIIPAEPISGYLTLQVTL